MEEWVEYQKASREVAREVKGYLEAAKEELEGKEEGVLPDSVFVHIRTAYEALNADKARGHGPIMEPDSTKEATPEEFLWPYEKTMELLKSVYSNKPEKEKRELLDKGLPKAIERLEGYADSGN